jgi:hypothetical protein
MVARWRPSAFAVLRFKDYLELCREVERLTAIKRQSRYPAEMPVALHIRGSQWVINRKAHSEHFLSAFSEESGRLAAAWPKRRGQGGGVGIET